MKKYFCILYIIFLFQYSYSQEYIKYFYPDSTVSSEGFIENGKPNGYWKSYFPSGVLKSIGKRTNFELDSIWRFYSEQGILQKEISYLQGKKNGYIIEYSLENPGKIVSKTLYVNDLRQGRAEYFTERGEIKKVVNFENDKLEGQAFEFGKDSIITSVLQYRNNELLESQKINRYDSQGKKTGTWMEFYPTGIVKTESNYYEGKLQGVYKLYDSRANIIRIGQYSNDSLLSSSQNTVDFVEPIEKIEYYADSTIKFRGAYKNSLPIGIQRYYNKKGEIDSSLLYDMQGTLIASGKMLENGNKEGNWIYYYAMGIKESEGTYLQNMQIGLWKFYYPSGKLKQEGNFMQNKYSGVWTWYFESGAVQKQEEYAMGKRNGLSVQYNEFGKKIVEGMYIDGKEQGKWVITSGDIITTGVYEYGGKTKMWESKYISGKLQFKGNYFNGKPQGKHEYFYENGVLEHQEIYKNGKPRKAWSYYNKQGELLYVVYYKNGREEKIVTVPPKM